jgi:glutathione S-transferase
MSTYKLYYFNGRGRAEVVRLIFAAAGEKFEDIRYEHNEWPSHKSEMPLGQLPILEFDGVKLPQSMAIARFVAKQFGLAGRDNLEQAKVDAVVDASIDLAMKFLPIHFEQDGDKKTVGIAKFVADELPKNLQNFEILAKLYSNGGPFFVGNHLNWCDLEVYDMLDYILQIDENALHHYPWLQNNRQEVEKQPKIAAYLKNRQPTSF